MRKDQKFLKVARKKVANAGLRKSRSARSEPRVNSFFAGIGGFDLGFQRVNIEPAFHCEINHYCSSVLDRHWPKVPSVRDIRAVSAQDIPEAQIWCGGFPCQDVSVARGWLGRDGLAGKNTGLFFPFAELVQARMPHVVVMENVVGLLNAHDGRDFAVILDTFNSLGYGVAWRVLNTRYFGAPQSRPRVYICAWKASATEAFNALFEVGPTHVPESQRLAFLRPTVCPRTGAHVPEVAFCLAATSGRHTGTDWSRSYVSYYDEVRRLTPTECERLQGFPEDWTLPAGDFHLSDDIDSLRYHAIGNAVSVPVVEWVGERIKAGLRSDKRVHNEDSDRETIRHAVQRVPDFGSPKASTVQLSAITCRDSAPKIKWRSGGVMTAGRCVMAPVSAAPNAPVNSRFVDILDKDKPSSRYFLSANAATGILRRVKNQNRVLFEPLDAALGRLAKINSLEIEDAEAIASNA